ncbi:monovalent cation/H+ antiporter complex subunit F [Ningiella sp. W23]|uniref:monovalent cation/H+ antiporter complex subunit F n=1 Tax=Ningiella sp. W23 TaxID=3023715 RepID=UPI00375714E7
MNSFLLVALVLLKLCLIVGLFRVWSSSDKVNGLLAAQLFGTIVITSTLVLGVLSGKSSLIDLSLVLALLASITVIAFLKLADTQDGD